MNIKKNIFENAYFGKPYKTRDGRKAIFLQLDTIVDEDGNDLGNLAYVYTLQDGEYSVALNGIDTSENDIILKNINTIELNHDIVSEWSEEITDEELDKLAVEYENGIYGYAVDLEDEMETDFSSEQNIVDIHDAYKAGCKEMLKRLL